MCDKTIWDWGPRVGLSDKVCIILKLGERIVVVGEVFEAGCVNAVGLVSFVERHNWKRGVRHWGRSVQSEFWTGILREYRP